MSNETFKIKNGLTLTPVDLTSLTNPQAGDLACDINDLNKIKRYDANSLGWTEVGSGGVGNVNALLTQTFDTAALAQFTQTGLALTTSNPIDGTQSARLIHQAASSQSFKQVIAVDRKYRGDLMAMSLQVRSSATSGNLTLLVTDETNSAVIMASSSISTGQYQVATAVTNATTTISGFSNVDINLLKVGMTITGAGIPTATVISSINTAANTIVISQAATASATITAKFSALPDRKSFSFTIPTNCASLSYTVTALQEAGLPESYVDDVVIELANVSLLETSVTVPNLTAWQGYTPTGNFSNTTYSGKWRQVGESIEIQVKGVLVGVPTGDISVGLPNGYVIDTTKLASSLPITHLGTGHAFDLSTNAHYELQIGYNTSTAFYATYNTGTSGQVSAVSPSLPYIWASGDSFDLTVKFPVVGLTASSSVSIPLTQSGLVQEADSEMILTGGTLASSAGSIATGFSVSKSTGSALLSATNRVTALVAGQYSVAISADSNSTTGLQLFVNGTAYSPHYTYAATGGSQRIPLTQIVTLKVNDYVEVRQIGAVAATSVTLSISRQGSLKQVSVNTNSKITIPTSELRFEGASTRGSTDTAIVKFDTQAKIRGDAFSVVNTAANGTVITMLKAGNLSVSSSMYFGATAATMGISLNQQTLTTSPLGSETLAISGASSASTLASCSTPNILVNVGDKIRIFTSAAVTSNAQNSFNLSFQEQEIQVSVSNTLPQFSESDSSVRLLGANGYGSTATKIRRFSSTDQNIGSDIEYTDSAANGGSFVVKTSGVYEISYSDNLTTSSYIGVSKNAASLTTNISGINDSTALAIQHQSAANAIISVNWSGSLVQGDVIRAHTDGVASGTGPLSARFAISKVGKPNVTGVNVTPFVNVPQPVTDFVAASGASLSANGLITTFGSFINTGSGILAQTSSRITANKRCRFSATATGVSAAAGVVIYAYKNGSFYAYGNNAYTATATTSVSVDLILEIGDYIEFQITNSATNTTSIQYKGTATALSDQILTAPETFSTDTASLQYASSSTYTLSTLANAPVGTFITFTITPSTNAGTQTTTAPTQTTADMNTNGILLTGRAFNATSTAAAPAMMAIQIGKGFKGRQVDGYASASKVTALSLDIMTANTTVEYGTGITYSEKTGILTLDAGTSFSGTSTTRGMGTTLGSAIFSGYLVINASKNPALTGMGIDRVAARGVNSAGTAYTSTASTLVYDATKIYDTHGALNAATGVFTTPISGYYQVNASVFFQTALYTLGTKTYLRGSKNGIGLTGVGIVTALPAGTFTTGGNYSDVVYLNKGDTFLIQVVNERGSTPLATLIDVNYFSIAKISGIN
jgi:hypothetical protein